MELKSEFRWDRRACYLFYILQVECDKESGNSMKWFVNDRQWRLMAICLFKISLCWARPLRFGFKKSITEYYRCLLSFLLQKRWKNVLAGPLCVRSRDSDSESVTEWKLQHMRLWNIRNFLYWQCGKIDKKKHILTIVPLIQTCYLKKISNKES